MHAAKLLLVGSLLALTADAVAAPIRVGAFKGVGTGGVFWHQMAHTASSVIGNMLANPDSVNIGPNLVVHPDGVHYTQFGRLSGSGSPSAEEIADFIAALDTLDVAVIVSVTAFESLFNSTQRDRLADFWKRKGVVSIHSSSDTRALWPAWDSLHGTRYLGQPSSDRMGMLKLDTISQTEPALKFLNRSLSDTTFLEEWFFFRDSGHVIRATPGLKVTINLDESTLEGGFGGRTAMGDHPMSWYREFSEGGRFFYTAMGHRPNLWTSAVNQPRFVRRQIYNAILWAAGYNEDGTRTVNVRGPSPARRFTDAARLSFSGSSLVVSVLKDGAHAIEVRGLDGRLAATRRGEGRVLHEFTGLRTGAVYIVAVTTTAGRFTRLATIP